MDRIDNQSQNKQLTTFVTLGIVFGAFGIHDFYIGKKVDGFLHLFLPIVFLFAIPTGLIIGYISKSIIFNFKKNIDRNSNL